MDIPKQPDMEVESEKIIKSTKDTEGATIDSGKEKRGDANNPPSSPPLTRSSPAKGDIFSLGMSSISYTLFTPSYVISVIYASHLNYNASIPLVHPPHSSISSSLEHLSLGPPSLALSSSLHFSLPLPPSIFTPYYPSISSTTFPPPPLPSTPVSPRYSLRSKSRE